MIELTRALLALLLVASAISIPLLFCINAERLSRFLERRFPAWVEGKSEEN
ncbi:hypothetical protein I6N98_13710 [Spongiibacter nanhainus]|uniref:Uncharacterized protein n=1 Tax=Spongiibacter nanhainus TaxID=2794344 RepID=A0A7T4QZ12_9GAMM|nr:hypothetical protein [Spongiibacter nanhainus]QQD17413.1 hypothetical protein I6N98_13710 [Spongiibacter nanhainus]